jgi:hypothetical protein
LRRHAEKIERCAQRPCIIDTILYRDIFCTARQRLRLLLVAFFAQEREHILLVRLHAGLVERVDAQDVAGEGYGFLEEVEELTEGGLGAVGERQQGCGDAARRPRKNLDIALRLKI